MSTPIKILLCEDEKFVARSYMRRLKLEGYTAIHASNGEEGIEKMRSEKPDLVLLDLLMPIKNGFEVLEKVGKDDELKHIPIIVTSNLGQKSDIDEAKKLGAVDFLVKSNISLKELMEKIKEHLPKTNEKI